MDLVESVARRVGPCVLETGRRGDSAENVLRFLQPLGRDDEHVERKPETTERPKELHPFLNGVGGNRRYSQEIDVAVARHATGEGRAEVSRRRQSTVAGMAALGAALAGPVGADSRPLDPATARRVYEKAANVRVLPEAKWDPETFLSEAITF